MSEPPLFGIFVGGRGTRMGGVAKGLLPAPEGGTLIERLLRTVEHAARQAVSLSVRAPTPVVLVGRAEAYAELGLPALADSPPGIGPLGGLSAVLARAASEGRGAAIVLSCDLPFITPELVFRLVTEHPGAQALAPRLDGLWSPLTARYAVDALPAVESAVLAQEHSLQKLFERLGAGSRELTIAESERSLLKDWDRPEDMRR